MLKAIEKRGGFRVPDADKGPYLSLNTTHELLHKLKSSDCSKKKNEKLNEFISKEVRRLNEKYPHPHAKRQEAIRDVFSSHSGYPPKLFEDLRTLRGLRFSAEKASVDQISIPGGSSRKGTKRN